RSEWFLKNNSMHFQKLVAPIRNLPHLRRFYRHRRQLGAVAFGLLLLLSLMLALRPELACGEPLLNGKDRKLIGCDNPRLFLAPYVWKRLQTNSTILVEATMPGAYIKTAVQGTERIGVVIDGT